MRPARAITAAMLVVLLAACGAKQGPRFALNGQIEGLHGDTLYLTGEDSRYPRTDTLLSDADGRFVHTLAIDTLAPLRLMLPHGLSLTLMADKQGQCRIEGTLGDPRHIALSGTPQNETLTRFALLADSLHDRSKLQAQIDSFVAAHPFDETGLIVLRDHCANVPDPDINALRASLKLMSGLLLDSPYGAQLTRALDKQPGSSEAGIFPAFHWIDLKGDTASNTNLRDRLLLVSYWASWDSTSLHYQRQLRQVAERFKKKNLTLINISLDYAKEQCMQAVERDSLPGYQICTQQGWDSPFAEKYGITNLPANLLVNTRRTITARNLWGDELTEKIEELAVDTKEAKGKKSTKSTQAKRPATTPEKRKTDAVPNDRKAIKLPAKGELPAAARTIQQPPK